MSAPSTEDVRKLADRIHHIMPQVEADGWLKMCRLTRDLIDVATVIAMERDDLASSGAA